MKCPNCQKRKAIIDETYGVTECEICRKSSLVTLSTIEFTTDSIKDQRREYKKDILHPFRDGVLSKEYIEEYGTRGIEVTPEQVKKAKYVWKDTSGWWNRDKSKGGRQN